MASEKMDIIATEQAHRQTHFTAAHSTDVVETIADTKVEVHAGQAVDYKTIARRERKRQQRHELLHSMTLDERKAFIHHEGHDKADKLQRLQDVMDNGDGHVTLAIDLRYDSIMNEKELKSLSKQVKFVYGSVKMMREPLFQLRLFHCSAPLRKALARFSADKWIVHWHDGADEELTDVKPAKDIVYLSPDSPNVLTSLDANKMYVIGGIVDKSRKKCATLHTAESAGVTTARLPIQEHITERLDHILNVNTVADVLIHFHTHGDWRRALTEALPQRKQSATGRRSKKRQELRSTDPHGDDDDDHIEKEIDDDDDDAVVGCDAGRELRVEESIEGVAALFLENDKDDE